MNRTEEEIREFANFEDQYTKDHPKANFPEIWEAWNKAKSNVNKHTKEQS